MGERTIHGLFDGLVWPDGYGVLTLPDQHRSIYCLSLTARPSPPSRYSTRPRGTPRSLRAQWRGIVLDDID